MYQAEGATDMMSYAWRCLWWHGGLLLGTPTHHITVGGCGPGFSASNSGSFQCPWDTAGDGPSLWAPDIYHMGDPDEDPACSLQPQLLQAFGE